MTESCQSEFIEDGFMNGFINGFVPLDMTISKATAADIPSLVILVNSAYRGEASKKGWTTEADLLKGELRTDITTLGELLDKEGAALLKYTSPEDIITGCVYLQKQERGLYLGMLSVSPEMQAAGIGKQLLAAAMLHAKETDCRVIFMNVISLRTELIAWYQRHGYELTGERKPLPDDNRFGIPTQPLEFVIMEKPLG
jgi:ribosomal protein S18 acetylase RimI-like enzyme